MLTNSHSCIVVGSKRYFGDKKSFLPDTCIYIVLLLLIPEFVFAQKPLIRNISTDTVTVCIGSTTQLTGSGIPATVNPWISGSPGVASINSTGLVMGISAGTSNISYTDNFGAIIFTIINIAALPVITTQPTDELDCEGHIVSFKVVATGSGLVFSWQRKYPSGIFAGIPLAGEPNISYPSPDIIRIQNVGSTSAPDGTQYRAVISNTRNCVTLSNPVKLTVNEITGITPAATNVIICQGNNYSYLVTTSYPSNIVSYQWKKWNNPGQWDAVTNGGAISGATSDRLIFTNSTPSETGQYKVTVIFRSSGADCNVTSDSRSRTLTVNASPRCMILGSAVIFSGSSGNIYTSSPEPVDNVTHSWTIGGNGTINGSAAGSSVLVNAFLPGAILLTDLTTRFGCKSTCNYLISVLELPCLIAPVTPVTNASSTIFSSPPGMDSYNWSISGNGSFTSGTTGQTVNVLAGSTCEPFTLTLNLIKNGASTNCSQTIGVNDNIRPSFLLHSTFSECVENIRSAVYLGATMDINSNRPEYFTFSHGDTRLDLDPSGFTDNCTLLDCLPLQIRWQADFSPTPDPVPPYTLITRPSVSGNGQPSDISGIILFYGDGVNFANITHSITYWIRDCAGNESLPQRQNIIIKPRPNIIK